MSSPFACNANNLFGNKAKGKSAAAPAEPVELIADKKYQVITAIIPFGTRQAANIRKHMHENVTHEGQRIFVFRQMNGWTTIALDSTETAPKLTVNPIVALKTAWREFSACPFIDPLTIKWKDSSTVLTYDDIDLMETQFDPLPDCDPDTTTGKNVTDGEVIYDAITAVDKKVVALDTKLAHCVDILDQLYYLVTKANDSPAGVRVTSTDATDEDGGSSSTDVVTVAVPEAPTAVGNKRKARLPRAS